MSEKLRPFSSHRDVWIWAILGILAGGPQFAEAGCSYLYQFNSGSAIMTGAALQMEVSMSGFSGGEKNPVLVNQMGYIPAEHANFTGCYLESGFPLPVQVAPGSLSGTDLVQTPVPQMTLAWTDGTNQVPVQYHVFFGDKPDALVMVSTQVTLSWQTSDLEYAKKYFWKIDTFDAFGRHMASVATFRFSLAPQPIAHLYCAPNPFRAGHEVTRFIFTMAGAGSGAMKMYSLPHADLVYATTLEHLQDGVNLWTYDGRDNHGQVLYNGVYLAVLELNGAGSHGIQKFKFIVAK